METLILLFAHPGYADTCLCARWRGHTGTLSLHGVEVVFVTSSAGQEHHLRKEKESFYHNPLPKYIFLQCSFPIWKDHSFSVKDVGTVGFYYYLF